MRRRNSGPLPHTSPQSRRQRAASPRSVESGPDLPGWAGDKRGQVAPIVLGESLAGWPGYHWQHCLAIDACGTRSTIGFGAEDELAPVRDDTYMRLSFFSSR